METEDVKKIVEKARESIHFLAAEFKFTQEFLQDLQEIRQEAQELKVKDTITKTSALFRLYRWIGRAEKREEKAERNLQQHLEQLKKYLLPVEGHKVEIFLQQLNIARAHLIVLASRYKGKLKTELELVRADEKALEKYSELQQRMKEQLGTLLASAQRALSKDLDSLEIDINNLKQWIETNVVIVQKIEQWCETIKRNKTSEESEAAVLSAMRRLHLRIESEAGVFMFGKELPKMQRQGAKEVLLGDASDYHMIGQRKLTELALKYNSGMNGIWSNPFIGRGSLPINELIRFLNNPLIFDKVGEKLVRREVKLSELVTGGENGPVSYVHYSIYPDYFDRYGRSFNVCWSILASPNLAAEIVAYVRINPGKAFDFFNTLIERPRYPLFHSNRKGRLYLVDGNKITPDDQGMRKSNLPRDCEIIPYEVK